MAKTSFVFLLLLVASFLESAAATNICTWGFYMCASNSKCIPSRNRCDGTRHCTGGEDEGNCPIRIGRCSYDNYFKCNMRDNVCIHRGRLCNGYDNCGNWADETTELCGGTAFNMRLVGGRNSNEGRVEVYYSPTGRWGTICDNGWDINDAIVVCRQLGLPRAIQAVGNARFGQGTGPILLKDVQCTGSESTLSKCPSSGWKNIIYLCGHGEDAGVVCGGSPLPSPTGTLPPTGGTGMCYSCSTSSNLCSTTFCAFDYGHHCYRLTADRVFAGSTSRVTLAGCHSNCSSLRESACKNQTNCQITCCRTSSCNSVPSSESSSFPSCYSCSSRKSYQDCEKKATLATCKASTASCYKMDYVRSYFDGEEKTFYKKGCTRGLISCSHVQTAYCSNADKNCNVYCCTGSGCNAGSIQRFSVVLLVTCAVVFFIL